MYNDKVFNFFLNITYRIKRIFLRQPRKFEPNMKLEIDDDFTNVDTNWHKRLWWGSYAEDEETHYQHPDCVIQLDKGVKLITESKPFLNPHNNKTIPFAQGLLYGKHTFYSGAIEVVVNIKPATGMWHAPLWFVTVDEVLPEIDVSEVYSKNNKNKAKSKSNLHYGTDYAENKKSIGAKTHYLPNFFNRDITFAIKWDKKAINIYHDGFLVRKITDKDILQRIQKGMVPIINTGVSAGYEHTGSEMIVKKFKYWK